MLLCIVTAFFPRYVLFQNIGKTGHVFIGFATICEISKNFSEMVKAREGIIMSTYIHIIVYTGLLHNFGKLGSVSLPPSVKLELIMKKSMFL